MVGLRIGVKTAQDIELQKVRLYLQLETPSLIPLLDSLVDGAPVSIPKQEGIQILEALENFSKSSGHDPTDENSIFASIRFWKKFIA